MKQNITVIITAAGQGTRTGLGYNKMLFEIANKPIAYHSVTPFYNHSRVVKIILVVSKIDKQTMENIVTTHIPNYQNKIQIVIGGDTRQQSVYNGLQKVETKYVIVHDGARPFISNNLINEVITSVENHGSAIVGTKVTDTIKHVTNNTINNTVDREPLWAVQTPQATLTESLKQAHKQAIKDNFVGTDESSLLEKYSNQKVHIVAGSTKNIKITTPEDVEMANFLYEQFNKNKEVQK